MKKLLDLIGNTPVIRLAKVARNSPATLWAKLENLNPGGSVKDRVCVSMLERAERKNLIRRGETTIVEASSGNTATGLALCCAAMGYAFTAVMPEDTEEEKVRTVRAFGGKIILTPAAAGLSGAVEKAGRVARENPGFYFADQFSNTDDSKVHGEKTAKEIAAQIPGSLDAFVCGVGTGGTLVGTGTELRKIYPEIRIVAVEPAECALLSGRSSGPHGIRGISPGFVPRRLDRAAIDRVVTVSTESARECARKLAREEGLLVGISSGASLFGALEVAREIGDGGQVLAVFCDGGEMYLRSGLYG